MKTSASNQPDGQAREISSRTVSDWIDTGFADGDNSGLNAG
jgi:hypothetical protein